MATAVIAAAAAVFERCVLARRQKEAGQKDSGKAGRKKKGQESGIKRIAVITGASSGLGVNYAKKISQRAGKYKVDEIWLIARRKERLEALAADLRIPARVLPMDLTVKEELENFGKLLSDEDSKNTFFSVSVLINCAGYGKYGSSAQLGHDEECGMIDVNDRAAVCMTDIALPYMHRGSRILNISSVAAFQPIPLFNAYAASKSFIYSYSRALRIELMDRGISVTTVCPYWVRDTEFIETAAGEKRHFFLSSTADSVTRVSLYDMRHCHALSTPNILSTLDRVFAGMIPDELLAYVMKKFL